jgi:hypothetical protein
LNYNISSSILLGEFFCNRIIVKFPATVNQITESGQITVILRIHNFYRIIFRNLHSEAGMLERVQTPSTVRGNTGADVHIVLAIHGKGASADGEGVVARLHVRDGVTTVSREGNIGNILGHYAIRQNNRHS